MTNLNFCIHKQMQLDTTGPLLLEAYAVRIH